MVVRCACPRCGVVYDEFVIDASAHAAPPCPRCGAWLLCPGKPEGNKLHVTSIHGLPELAAIGRQT
jgi:hypothetical protein